ncbi:diguanylate cyclase domain-containing protein [Uliginosibacterium sediminicola]|uniref:Diguanylate cyclase n=1 Tax=Uliginosibacterium sediminicola TaxID=2024550 RepID=A0ABU9YTB5_9RHOO
MIAADATSLTQHDREQQRLLAASMRIGMLGMLAATPLGALWLVEQGEASWAALWALAMVTQSLLSMPLAMRLLRSGHQPGIAQRTERLYVLKMLLCGGLCAALSWWPGASEHALLELALMQTLLLLTSSVVLVVSRLAFPALLISLSLPVIVRLLQQPPAVWPEAGIAFMIIAIVLALAHQIMHRSLRRLLQRRDVLMQEQEALFHAASEGIMLIRDERIVKCNWQGAAMLGLTPEEVMQTRIRDWLHDELEWSSYEQEMTQSFTRGERFSFITRLRKHNGDSFFAELSASSIDPDGRQAGVVLVATDISVRLATEAELRNSERRFRRLLSLSSDWYWEQDEQFRFTQVTGTRLDATHDSLSAIIGRTRWEFDTPGTDEQRWAAHRATLEAHLPFTDFIYQMRTGEGKLVWFSITGHPMYDELGNFCGYHGVGMDITERIAHQERYHHLAHHDTLTGLPNRRLLFDRLEQATAYARRNQQIVAILMLDLDGFKAINDSDGHEAGDQVLIAVADRLRSQIRESDTLCRMGGDEFVILLPEVANANAAELVAHKIIIALGIPFDIDRKRYKVGTSIGISLYPTHTEDAEKLLGMADAAMYQAKQAGGNQYCFAQLGDQGLLPLDTPA